MNRIFALSFIASLSMTACTAEQAYNTGQAWQKNQCGRYQDKADYDRCMGSAAPSYDAYKRETESNPK